MTSPTPQPRYASVAVDDPIDMPLTYRVPPELLAEVQIGSRVTVSLGHRPTTGTVLELTDTPPALPAPEKAAPNQSELFAPEPAPDPIKPIRDVLRQVAPLPGDLLDLARWISSYYCCPIGMTLAAMVPAAVKRAARLPQRQLLNLTTPGEPLADLLARIKLSAPAKKALTLLHPALLAAPVELQTAMQTANCSKGIIQRLITQTVLTSRREILFPQRAEPVPDVPDAPAEPDFALTPDQTAALVALEPLLTTPRFAVRLLHGVTGSGKTEVYIRAIAQVLAQGKSALVLVPEISLTPQAVQRFTRRFPRIAVLHSGMRDQLRHQHWHAIAGGWAQVVVGARSAVFAPLPNLGLIIVDEEHDGSYKQDEAPRYHGRDVAIKRAQSANIPIILGTATPALETYHNTRTNPNFALLELRQRPPGIKMPTVRIVDMVQEQRNRRGLHILSMALERGLTETLAQKGQAIILLNRRGYAHYITCNRCGFVLMCTNCDATLVVHRAPHAAPNEAGGYNQVRCHYCQTTTILPSECPDCHAKLSQLGQGTQRAEDELLRKFPGLRLARMDSDTMERLADYEATLAAFGRGELDVLLGTQMIAKGLDFANVRLVGVLNADVAMAMPDFRAAERTFQLVCQVAGRAGRSTDPGRVFVQTYQPQLPALTSACQHDYAAYVQNELPQRQEYHYPPYGRLVRMVLAHKSDTLVRQHAQALADLALRTAEHFNLPVTVSGPQPPPMNRLMDAYRFEIILSAPTAGPLQQILHQARRSGLLWQSQIPVQVDVDPLNMF
jgi:primosomal protein N' (replication factor Y)